MEGTQTYRRWLQRATVYAVSMTAAGAITGLVFALAGAGVYEVWPDALAPLAAAVGVVAFAYALHEAGVISLRVPGRDWQVPVEWVSGGFYRSAVIFGSIVGFGVFTRVHFASLPVLLAWVLVSGNPLYGLLAGLVYGATRAASIYVSAGSRRPDELASLNSRLMQFAPTLHHFTGLALAAFGAYMLTAPFLPY